ncbi:MAG: Bax inhibitor-1 family protein, partial [Geminicoccales bacterium]
MAFGPEPHVARAQVGVERIDEGLRSYMLSVYNYMGLGLVTTGVVAYFMAASGFYLSLAQTPLIWVVMLAPLGFVFFLSFRIQKMSVGAAQLTF